MAKVLIDIPKAWSKCKISFVKDCIKSGIVLDGLTKGEVMHKMFPNETKTSDIGLTNEYGNTIHRTYINGVTDFTTDWWNAKWGE